MFCLLFIFVFDMSPQIQRNLKYSIHSYRAIEVRNIIATFFFKPPFSITSFVITKERESENVAEKRHRQKTIDDYHFSKVMKVVALLLRVINATPLANFIYITPCDITKVIVSRGPSTS